MVSRINLILIAGLSILFSYCGNQSDENRVTATCQCLAPLELVNANLKQAIAANDQELILDYLSEASEVAKIASDCLRESNLNPGSPFFEEEAVMRQLNLKCPGWEALLQALPPS
jgi:hypothetical protein